MLQPDNASIAMCCRLVIPLVPVFLLVRRRRNLNAPKVQLQLGYIYRIYRYSHVCVVNLLHISLKLATSIAYTGTHMLISRSVICGCPTRILLPCKCRCCVAVLDLENKEHGASVSKLCLALAVYAAEEAYRLRLSS